MFKNIEKAPPDAILGLNEAFKNERSSLKITLGVGVYRDEYGNTPILESVKKAEKIILDQEKTKNYLPIEGSEEYTSKVKELVFGKNSHLINNKRVVTVQSSGGTGALRIAGDFLHKFFPRSKIWLSDPTWENHKQVFNSAGMNTDTYPYYDKNSKWLDFNGICEKLNNIPSEDIVLFHAACHNPTGIDPNKEEWVKISNIVSEKNLLVLFDFAYQGFGNGLDEDAYAVRLFADKVKNFMVANSFSKNFGLYNERVGGLSVIANTPEEAENILSQLKICIRTLYSNPPNHGASIVSTILNDPDLHKQWLNELKVMRDRINHCRKLFVDELKSHGIKENFDFVLKQKGMFSYSGLTSEQVKTLKEKYALYMVSSGRINLAGINDRNIARIAQAIAKVL